MSLLMSLSRILIGRQVNAGGRTVGKVSLGKFSQTAEKAEDQKEGIGDNFVYDYDPKDRSEVIDVETSIRYLESEAFKTTYGDNPVWVLYRRNTTGHKFRDTRETCIIAHKISTASPCPICRDKYLVPHYKNVKLLKHFISPHHGGLLPTMMTGVCQKQHQKLKVEILKAKEYGTISFDVPFRFYDYNYYKELSKKRDLKESS